MTEPLAQSEQNFTEIKNNCEDIIQKILGELKAHKEEQAKFKEQLLSVIEENNCINSKINANQTAVTNVETPCQHEQLTNDAISNLQQQVQHLKEERCTINCLWKTSQETIANLETEIQNYRQQLFKPSAFAEIKSKYCATIKCLENVVQQQKDQISKQDCTIQDLEDSMVQACKRIKELKATICDQEAKICASQQLEATNDCLKKQLETVKRKNSELELSTNLAKSMIDERFDREKNALEKLQEALCIAETAVAEKEEALKREIVIKEECEALATTIGQVMEEAACKVERNVECLRLQYEEKERALQKRLGEAMEEIEKQMRATCTAEARSRCLEGKLKEALQENERLENDLELASESIAEMELKLDATENLLKEDKRSDTMCEEREQQIKQYIETNKQLKERWKRTIEDVTKKFGCEIQRLQKENANLKAEIQAQRQKMC